MKQKRCGLDESGFAGLCRALNRTLVLPRFRCWCDQDW